jgi:hypothetical protein
LFCNFGAQSALARRDCSERLSGGHDGIGEVDESRVSHLALRSFSRYKNAMPKKVPSVSQKIGFIETMELPAGFEASGGSGMDL